MGQAHLGGWTGLGWFWSTTISFGHNFATSALPRLIWRGLARLAVTKTIGHKICDLRFWSQSSMTNPQKRSRSFISYAHLLTNHFFHKKVTNEKMWPFIDQYVGSLDSIFLVVNIHDNKRYKHRCFTLSSNITSSSLDVSVTMPRHGGGMNLLSNTKLSLGDLSNHLARVRTYIGEHAIT